MEVESPDPSALRQREPASPAVYGAQRPVIERIFGFSHVKKTRSQHFEFFEFAFLDLSLAFTIGDVDDKRTLR